MCFSLSGPFGKAIPNQEYHIRRYQQDQAGMRTIIIVASLKNSFAAGPLQSRKMIPREKLIQRNCPWTRLAGRRC
jgi:hypothetical protein